MIIGIGQISKYLEQTLIMPAIRQVIPLVTAEGTQTDAIQ